jgi:hypothetical protein
MKGPSMRVFVALAWLTSCSDDGARDDHQPRPPHGGDDDAAMDREECERARVSECPPGWGFTINSGPGAGQNAGDLEYVELEDVGEPVCNGQGVYATPEALQGAGAIAAVTLVKNSQCVIVGNPECALGSLCWAERSDGQQCGTSCTYGQGITEDECTDFVAECIGNGAAVCAE